MKAAINKITEGAKLRDTVGRNQCPIINTKGMSATDLLSLLFNYQITISSDNVEKITNVILLDENKHGILLKYRGLSLTGMSADEATSLQSRINFTVVSNYEEALQSNKEEERDGDNND